MIALARIPSILHTMSEGPDDLGKVRPMEDPDRSTIPNLLAGQDPNGAEKNEPAAIEKTPTRHIEDTYIYPSPKP